MMVDDNNLHRILRVILNAEQVHDLRQPMGSVAGADHNANRTGRSHCLISVSIGRASHWSAEPAPHCAGEAIPAVETSGNCRTRVALAHAKPAPAERIASGVYQLRIARKTAQYTGPLGRRHQHRAGKPKAPSPVWESKGDFGNLKTLAQELDTSREILLKRVGPIAEVRVRVRVGPQLNEPVVH